MDRQILLKRLATVKLLYKRSFELSKQSESTAFLSILGFHDAIDMYLNIAVQHLNLKPEKGKTFLANYLSLVPGLKHVNSILKLNENRNNIKHNASTVHNLEVEAARVHTTEFFEDNTKKVFGIDFRDISLIELVTFHSAKRFLLSASEKLSQNDIKSAMMFSTLAFDKLIADYKKTKYSWRSSAGFEFTKSVGNSTIMRLEGKSNPQLENLIDAINENFQNVSQALEILALGIDYRKYAKFRAIAPLRYHYNEETKEFISTSYKEKKWIKENCEFIIDFVIESALILQEMDYDFMELQNINNGIDSI